MNTRTLVFDVTTLVERAELRPTGIDRVLLETALVLADGVDVDVGFCSFDRDEQVYRRVTSETVHALASKMRGSDPPTLDFGTSDDREIHWRRQGKLMVDRMLRNHPKTRAHLRRGMGHGARVLAETAHAAGAFRHEFALRGQRNTTPCFSKEWGPGATYCSLGIDFAYNDHRYLRKQSRSHGFRVAIMVYDLIPVVAPHFATISLRGYFREILECCDEVLVISEVTGEDLRHFARDEALPLPAMTKVPLGSTLSRIVPTRPEGVELAGVPFVLVVGTITLRKNHHLLLDVWNKLVMEFGAAATPRLVVAGVPGSLSEETLARFRRDPQLRGVVMHLEKATDAEIAWLYRHCMFSVYPSLYEGWGLPVSESLDFGKVCLASDRTSLPEAGEGLAVHLDPLDRQAWMDAVVDFWTDHGKRRKLEQRIAQEHVLVTAVDTARAIWQIALRGGTQ